MPIHAISGAMGHDSEVTTQIYLASIQTSQIDEANSMNRIKFQFNDKNRKCSVDEIYPDRLKTPADAVGVSLIQTRLFNGTT